MSVERPPPCHPLLRAFATLVLRLAGWSLVGEVPPAARSVVLAYPHTSNWDYVWGVLGCWAFGVSPSWLGKHTLFRWPFGAFMRWTGGIPVDRRAPQGLVHAVADAMRRPEGMLLLVPPEGTRARVERWRSGFYWIAREADAVIVCGIMDYLHRHAGYGAVVRPSDDARADMDQIRAGYREVFPKDPSGVSPILIDAEDAGPGDGAPG